MTNDERKESLLAEAKAIAEKFGQTQNLEQRQELQARYKQIDRELEGLKEPPALGSPEHVFQLEAQLRRGVMERAKKASGPGRDERVYGEEVEKGRKHLMEKVHAKSATAKPILIKTELNYLLANYTSANDAKIETLIDRWRRSGDPDYDPSIKVKHRNVRKKAETNKHAF